MDIRRIAADFAVSDQLTANDVAQAHSLGFQSIICNRPDGEDVAQPLFESIAAAAYNALPKPVLAYCKTGTRSATTFGLAFPNGR
ncbi:sulfur transferase domain-containing protein [Yoonia sp.]|uniref:beta-lactamase hydrolase domain-containing protein n=1 Tax=Yoonia sp. TaxID=2212373 RepID=UPI0025D2EBAD|nr:sulfur transferase domain-containing protein [Yoonia sp.]